MVLGLPLLATSSWLNQGSRGELVRAKDTRSSAAQRSRFKCKTQEIAQDNLQHQVHHLKSYKNVGTLWHMEIVLHGPIPSACAYLVFKRVFLCFLFGAKLKKTTSFQFLTISLGYQRSSWMDILQVYTWQGELCLFSKRMISSRKAEHIEAPSFGVRGRQCPPG